VEDEMSQLSFGDAEYAGKRKQTRREKFLAEMEQVVPWQRLVAVIEPYYPKAGRGRRPYPLETMLRVHLLQNWYGYSDPAMEEALYEIAPLRQFARLNLVGAIPDETTILNFRRLLETHVLAPELFAQINAYLAEKNLLLKQGTIVDATIIHAPSSTKNAEGKRDPEMHQTKKGNQWYHGMKAHTGVDMSSGLVHSVTTTPANIADVTQLGALLHGDEEVVYGDGGYTGAEKREELQDLDVDFRIARRRHDTNKLAPGPNREIVEKIEHFKAKIRARVEHPYRVIKLQFGYTKVRFRGLAKNTAQLMTLFGLSNLWMVRKRLLAIAG
jgi:transposase, IS5 family